MKIAVAIIGSGNIGTDLMYKLIRSPVLEPGALIGIDPASEGLARARKLGVEATHEGIAWLLHRADRFPLVFEATSARVHARHAPLLKEAGVIAIDLTPAAVGPPVVPSVNLEQHLDEPNVNMITCGGQAAIPIVAAVTRMCDVPYAEMVSAIASRSAGPGTRQNIDEFTRTTARGLETIGGAGRGKAIIILNPAEPPLIMRNTVYCGLGEGFDAEEITASIVEMAAEVATYVPGYRLKAPPIIDEVPFSTSNGAVAARVTTLLEVEGAGDYLPMYAGNLDIMTSAALRVGETLAKRRLGVEVRA